MLSLLAFNLALIVMLFVIAWCAALVLCGNWLGRIVGIGGLLVCLNVMAWSLSPSGKAALHWLYGRAA